MHMVGHATRPVTFTAGIARDRGQIRMDFWPCADIEQGTALLRAEYDVNDDEAQRLWHGVDFGPTARFIPAWGNAPGIRVIRIQERQRRDSSGSTKTDVRLWDDMDGVN